MPELPVARQGGLMTAGEGKRLLQGLIERGEVESDGDVCRFVSTGTVYEKGLTHVAPPDPRVAGDGGVTVLDLAVKDLLYCQALDTITFLTNPDSQAPERYGKRIDRAAFLQRLGLLPVPDSQASRYVTCHYRQQQPRSASYPYYGTALAVDLISQGIDLGDAELLLITEADSAYVFPQGQSLPAEMLGAMPGNPRSATVGMGLARMTDDVSLANGLGMVLAEREDGAYYLDHIIESQGHADLDQARASGKSIWRNTSRYVVDAAFLATNRSTMTKQPSTANNGEYQVTDTLNDHTGPIYAHPAPDEATWYDLGRVEGLVAIRRALSGLCDARNPIWGRAVEAPQA